MSNPINVFTKNELWDKYQGAKAEMREETRLLKKERANASEMFDKLVSLEHQLQDVTLERDEALARADKAQRKLEAQYKLNNKHAAANLILKQSEAMLLAALRAISEGDTGNDCSEDYAHEAIQAHSAAREGEKT